MLLTDGWWGERVTENTSRTAGGRKTVKQNQSHIQLACSRCARWGLHVHPQQFFFFLSYNLLHTHTSSCWPLPHFSGVHIALILVHQVQLGSSLWCTGTFIFSPALCAGTHDIIWGWDRKPCCFQNPQLLRVLLQLPAVKTRKQLKLAPS